MRLTRTDTIAAASAALFLGLLAGESLLVLAQDAPGFEADPAKACSLCEDWNEPLEPFRIFGDTYYVGTAGLSAVLIASDDGHVLLDGGLPQSAALIDRNIRALGFNTEDVRLILNSHAHYDHAGGIAALQRESGATVAASPRGADALERGEPTQDDPQFGLGREANAFPAVAAVHRVADGMPLRVGRLEVTPVFTPGHTPGGTTWTWRSCEEGRCLSIVYADSLNPVSADEYRFTDEPETLTALEDSIARVANLPCDVLITVHPDFGGLAAKRDALLTADDNPFIDTGACRAYAAQASDALRRRVVRERGAASAL